MATKKRKPRTFKQDLIWKSGGMLGHLGCGKTNIETAELNARRILASLINSEPNVDTLQELGFTRTYFLEVCQDLSTVLARFQRVIHDVHSAAQERIREIPKNDNTPSL